MVEEYTKYYQRLGQSIAYYRKKRHLTQEGLAIRANISRAYISHIEADRMNTGPSLDILFRLCTILNIEPYQLFTELPDDNK